MRVSGFDLGTNGATFRAEKVNGVIRPLSCERWSWPGRTDDQRYGDYLAIAKAEIKWADAVGYEHVQFNRGKSLIEGFRAILIAQAEEEERFCAGINVASLKKFAINGRWSDADRKKRGKKKIDGKKRMQMALMADHPQFISYMHNLDGERVLPITGKLDDLIDAAWVAIWVLETVEIS